MKKGILMLGALLALLIALSGTVAACPSSCTPEEVGHYKCYSDPLCEHTVWQCLSVGQWVGVNKTGYPGGPATARYFDKDGDGFPNIAYWDVLDAASCGLRDDYWDCVDDPAVNSHAYDIRPTNDEICNNGFNDNCDNLTDCADPACHGQRGPGVTTCCANSSVNADCPAPACSIVSCVLGPTAEGGTCFYSLPPETVPVDDYLSIPSGFYHNDSTSINSSGNVLTFLNGFGIEGVESFFNFIAVNKQSSHPWEGVHSTSYTLDRYTGNFTHYFKYYRKTGGLGGIEQITADDYFNKCVPLGLNPQFVISNGSYSDNTVNNYYVMNGIKCPYTDLEAAACTTD